MEIGRIRRLFGVGPAGAAISIILMVAAVRVDRGLGHPEILPYPSLLAALGALSACVGLVLLFWTMQTLRSWWSEGRLCTAGPFRWFRHPMYAAWITFVSLGIVLCLDSWVVLAWLVLQHILWHRLVAAEERMMEEHFQEEYRSYAERTGRFVPRFSGLTRRGG